MKIKDFVKLAWRNLMRRKSRTLLTVLSVVIGALSIIIMLSFGFGIQKQNESMIKNIASLSSIEANPSKNVDSDNPNSPVPKDGVITDEVVEKVRKIPNVKSAIPTLNVYSGNFGTKKKAAQIWSNVKAVDNKVFEENEIKDMNGNRINGLKKGEFVVGKSVWVYKTSGNMESGRFDVKPDEDFNWEKESFFFGVGYKERGDMLDISGGKKYEEIKLKYAGKYVDTEVLDQGSIYVNFDTLKEIEKINQKLSESMQEGQASPVKKNTKKKRYYDNLHIVATDMNHVEDIRKTLEDDYKLSSYSSSEFINAEKERMKVLQLVLGGIGSVAFFVAAIGIANTMLMSINERTKEIGVMKVIGAQVSDIRLLFLLEAMLIGVIGGLVGIGISYIATNSINGLVAQRMAEETMMMGGGEDSFAGICYIPFWLPFAALFFSALVGLVAGYIPASRATKLSAIEAIRQN